MSNNDNVLYIDVSSSNEGFQHDEQHLSKGKKESVSDRFTTAETQSLTSEDRFSTAGTQSLTSEDRFSTAGTQSLTSEDLNTDFGLHQAARDGSVDAIKKKLNQCENEGQDILRVIDLRDVDALAPLHHAATSDSKEAAALLLDKGAFIDVPGGEDSNTPLHLAAMYNCVTVARLLVARGASINMQNVNGSTALHFSARRGCTEIANLLLDQSGINIKIKDNSEVTVLHQAAVSGDVEITAKLIVQGADINAFDTEGENALHFAAAEGNSDVIECIMSTFEKEVDGQPNIDKVNYINNKSNASDTALHLACTAGYEDCVKLLIAHGADVNIKAEGRVAPLHLAATNGNTQVASELIHNQAKINVRDEDLTTPLHNASMYGRIDMIKFLLERGSMINARDKDNYTPLLASVWKGQTEAAKLLCDEGAKIHSADTSLKTCVHLAVQYDHCDTLLMLMEGSAVGLVNSTDEDYRTPLHYAAIYGNIECLKILLSNGADQNFGDHEEKTPLHHAAKYGKPRCVELLCETMHADLNSTDDDGRMPLHLAAMYGNVAVIKILVDMGAEIDARDNTNWTPLDYAAKYGFFKSASILLENDSPVDACDKNNNTPLHWAAENGHMECVTLLLDNGADITLKDINGKNCLDLAIENNEQSVCMALITHSRWREVLDNIDKDGSNPMKKLIKFAPDIAEVVMDKCIEESKHARKNNDFFVTYDFHYIDVNPSLRSLSRVSLEPVTMAAYQREKLLSHPLTKKLIAYKWSKLGRPIYYFTLLIYLFFVACVTSVVVIERDGDRNKQLRAANNTQYQKNNDIASSKTFKTVVPILTVVICCLNLFKELIQVLIKKKTYFSQGTNYLEWALYISTLVFMLPFLLGDASLVTFEMKWNAGAISILLTWFDLLLFLARFPYFGLYVVMFIEVLKTVLRVFLVFAIFIVGFALSFFVLLREQSTYSSVGKALIKVAVMSIGEIEYNTVFTENLNKTSATTGLKIIPMEGVTYIIFSVFLLLMPIIMMNLLVGLAVGDIEAVRKTAFIRILKQQVDIIHDMENNYPSFIINMAYIPKLVEYPNQVSCFETLRSFLGYDDEYGYLKEEQAEQADNDEELHQRMDDHHAELIKQKKHIKHLKKILKKIADKLDIEESGNE